MSEAAAAMGRKDADRWLAKAVIEIVAAEKASRAAAPAGGPAASQPPPPAAPARQPQAQPGSLFTPNRTQSARGETAKSQPQGGQPASGGGRHRHAR
jgi:hypothetical protein